MMSLGVWDLATRWVAPSVGGGGGEGVVQGLGEGCEMSTCLLLQHAAPVRLELGVLGYAVPVGWCVLLTTSQQFELGTFGIKSLPDHLHLLLCCLWWTRPTCPKQAGGCDAIGAVYMGSATPLDNIGQTLVSQRPCATVLLCVCCACWDHACSSQLYDLSVVT